MNVLVHMGNDAANQQMIALIKQLGINHNVRIIAQKGTIGKLVDQGIPSGIIGGKLAKFEAWADVVLASPMSSRGLIKCSKYIFMIAHMNPNFDQVRGYDFLFTHCNIRRREEMGLVASVPVGNVKADLDISDKQAIKEKKSILYIDAGHFPFGRKGKNQIVDALLEVVEKYKDYQLVIRPRWPQNATASQMSNVNFYHIFDAIEDGCKRRGWDEIPENIIFSKGSESLSAQIAESCLVISSITSAYMDAAFAGKPLIVLKGFENEDMYHERNGYMENMYDFLSNSGCLVDCKDLVNYVPEGLYCTQEHLQSVVSYLGGTINRIIETMEYVYVNYICHNRFPKAQEYSFENLDLIECDDNITSIDDLIARRMSIAYQTVICLNHKISRTKNWDELDEGIYKLCEDANKYNLKKVNNLIEEYKNKYLVSCIDEFRDNEVELSFVMNALHLLSRFEELTELCGDNSISENLLSYYKGWVFDKNGDKQFAVKEFEKSIEFHITNDYPIYKWQESDNIEKLFKYTIAYYFKEKDYANLNKILEMLITYLDRQGKGIQGCTKGYLFRILRSVKIKRRIKKKLYRLAVENKSKKELIKALFRYLNSAKEKVIKKKKKINKERLKMLLKSKLGILDENQKDLKKFKNKYKGKKAIVVGNGPSLRTDDLEKLQEKGFVIFASNKIYKIFENTKWRPDIYACTDGVIFGQNKTEILGQIESDVFINKKFGLDCELMPKDMIKAQVHYIHYYSFKKAKFIANGKYFYSGSSVTMVLLALAHFMGIREVYLIGCDHDYPSYQGRELLSKVVADESLNTDYFTKNYLKPGEKVTVGDVQKTEQGYISARDYLKKHGTKVYNATRGGKLEVFERVNLDDLIK